MLQMTLPVAPEFWAVGPSGGVTVPTTSERALRKAPIMQVGPEPPALAGEKLAC